MGKYAKINLNKNSVGFTVGTKGMHYTANSNGKTTKSIGVPGTGIYYSETSNNKSSKKQNDDNNYNYQQSNNNCCKYCGEPISDNMKICSNCGKRLDTKSNTSIIIALILFFPLGLYWMWAKSEWKKPVKLIITGLYIIYIMCFIGNGGSNSSNTNDVVQQTTVSVTQSTTESTTATTTAATTTTTTTTTTTKKITERSTTKKNTTTEEYIPTYVLNKSTGKFHHPSCYMVDQMNDSNKKEIESSYDDMISKGYSPCKKCIG